VTLRRILSLSLVLAALVVCLVALPAFTPVATQPPGLPAARPAIAVADATEEACPAPVDADTRRRAAACLLSGRGMWIWEFDTVSGGDANSIVRRALDEGLSYVLVRAGSSRMGFYAQSHLDALLPAAHAAGLKVLAWDFPYLDEPEADARRVASELAYATPDGHHIDGLAPDVEEPAQGVTLTRDRAARFARELRRLVGPAAIVVGCTPRPTPPRVANYPYAELAPHVDAFAPMVYWGFEDPGPATNLAIRRLEAFGLPVAPVGRAYDMRPEGGPNQPPASETLEFMRTARQLGAPGVSFWSWQHASMATWRTIREFDWTAVR
jgi:hypothetical protein